MLEKIKKIQNKLGRPVAYGYFKLYDDCIIFVADGGHGGGYYYSGKVVPGEEGSFFSGCKSREEALKKALDFVMSQEYKDACATASFGAALGDLMNVNL